MATSSSQSAVDSRPIACANCPDCSHWNPQRGRSPWNSRILFSWIVTPSASCGRARRRASSFATARSTSEPGWRVMEKEPEGRDQEMNAFTEMLISRDTPMHETLTQELSVIAAQLIEAACRARDRDHEATKAPIAHAIALLRGIPSLGPRGTRLLSNVETHVVRGGLPAWQTRRIIAHVEANLSRRIPVQELAR